MENINKLLQTYITNYTLKRYGPLWDGGYVAPREIMEHCKNFISFGIGQFTDFEKDVITVNPNCQFDMYDYSIEKLPIIGYDERYLFHKIKVGNIDNQEEITFHKILQDINCTNNVCLKMDIEGDEYKVIDSITDTDLNRIDCLIMEIHNLHCDYDKAIALMKKLNDNFVLVHKHIGEWEYMYSVDDFTFADEYELTFINKSLVQLPLEENHSVYPIKGLDYKSTNDMRMFANVNWKFRDKMSEHYKEFHNWDAYNYYVHKYEEYKFFQQ